MWTKRSRIQISIGRGKFRIAAIDIVIQRRVQRAGHSNIADTHEILEAGHNKVGMPIGGFSSTSLLTVDTKSKWLLCIRRQLNNVNLANICVTNGVCYLIGEDVRPRIL